MGCNASQEPIILANENGNVTATSAADEDHNNGDGPPQQQQSSSPTQSPDHQQQQQQQPNQSEPEVSTVTANNNDNVRNGSRGSPGNKPMTPKSVTPPVSSSIVSSPSSTNRQEPRESIGNKKQSFLASAEQLTDENEEIAQSPPTTTSAAASVRSSSEKSVATADAGEIEIPGEEIAKKATTANGHEICSNGASDLANNLVNSISETNKEQQAENATKEKEPNTSTIELSEFGNEEVEAATKIQAVFRGHKVRATIMKPGDDDSSTKGAAAGNDESTGGAAKTPTKDEFEAEFDPNDKELCDAAVRIQATFRGHLARKGKDLKDEKDIQEITKKVAEELDIDLSDPELNKAATKIQATFRRHRKE